MSHKSFINIDENAEDAELNTLNFEDEAIGRDGESHVTTKPARYRRQGFGKGKKGFDGDNGESGGRGVDIVIYASHIVWGDFIINTTGGKGGDAGHGGKGGKGSNAVKCKHEGQDGGEGGKGGDGGYGGSAGKVEIYYKTLETLYGHPVTSENFKMGGGAGGLAGSAGHGGRGGNSANVSFPGCDRDGGNEGSKGIPGRPGGIGQYGMPVIKLI